MPRKPLSELDPNDAETGDHNVVVETPSGSRNKLKYDPELDVFKLSKVMPAGAVFPFDFGFIPSTRAEDGDPIDVLVLMEQPLYPGCLVAARVVGAIEAEQTEHGKTERNDRLIAVACESDAYRHVKELADLGEGLLGQIEHFFISYNAEAGKQFKPVGRADARRARKLVDEARERFGKRKS